MKYLINFYYREIFESTGDDSLTLSFPKSKNTEFTAFTIERDHVGKILSVISN